MTLGVSRLPGRLNEYALSQALHSTLTSPLTSMAMVSRPQRSQVQMNWVRYFVLDKLSLSRREVTRPRLANLAPGKKMER